MQGPPRPKGDYYREKWQFEKALSESKKALILPKEETSEEGEEINYNFQPLR